MAKRHLFMVMCVLMFGAALVAQGQENTPHPEQATVDAAVQTLIAQTQGADVQVQMTGTIQAALEGALTATAQAQTLALTATPTPAPVNWSNVSLAGTTDIELWAGPAQTSAFLAPDGTHFAYRKGKNFCLYNGVTEEKCIALDEEMKQIDGELLRWSPDSRYLIFTEDFFRLLNDPDIWVWDTAANEIHDLTDDGEGNFDISDDTVTNIDLVPTFLPDGRILFLRYSRTDGQMNPPDIYTINADGSGETQLGTIQLSDPFNDPFPVYALDASATHLVYAHAAQHELPDDGVWISDLDGGNPRQLVQTDREHVPMSMDLSADERYVLVTPPIVDFDPGSEASRVYLVDVARGEMLPIDPERTVVGAGWSPEGSALLYLTFQQQDAAETGLYFSETPGTSGRKLLGGRYNIPTSLQRQSLMWAANNLVLLSRIPEQGIVLAQLAR